MAQEIMKKRAAIYVRCSSEEAKTEGYSPETQEEKAKELIRNNCYGLDERYIYKDIGHSGGTDKRPGLQKLLESAREKKFNLVVVYRMDRFFRNLRLLLNTVGELKDLGIEFKSVTEPFDTSTPTGRAMFANAGVFAEWMREIGLESRNEGMIKAVKQGKWVGSGLPPFGYDFDPTSQKLKINVEEAKIVKMIFEWLVYEELTLYKIQKRLNEMKVLTKFDRVGRVKKSKSKGWWQLPTIHRMLQGEIYTGNYHWRRYYRSNRSRSKENLRPEEDWILVKVPAVISKELFEKAQERLKNNRKFSSKKTKRAYVFQYKLVCGLDGRKYIASHNAPRKPYHEEVRYYMCPSRAKNLSPVKCSAPCISESRILPVVWDNLKTLLSQPEITFNKFKKYCDQEGKEINVQEKLAHIEKRSNF